MAWDLSRTPDDGVARAVLRRCAPVELRRCSRRRIAGSSSISTTSMRRCRRRSSGTSSAWRRAVVVAARDNGHRRKEQRAAARAAAAAYRTTMAKAARMRFLDVWYTRFDADKVLAELAPKADKGAIKSAQKALAKAQTRTSLGSLAKFAQRVDGGYRIKQQPPVIVRPPETLHDDFEQIIRQGLADYASSLRPDRRVVLDHYHYEDFARKVSGVGSVGTEAMMILLMGDARGRSAVPADQGGEHFGARPVCGRQRVRAPGRAGGARPAAHAVRQRRLPRLGHRDRRAPARVLCPPAARHEGLGRRSRRCRRRAWRSTASSAAPPWRARTRAPATRQRSPATSATTTRSTAPSNASPSPTPTRTTPTTRRSPRPRRSSASTVERGV